MIHCLPTIVKSKWLNFFFPIQIFILSIGCLALEFQAWNFATIILCVFEFHFLRGFLKSDKLIGTVNVKLQPLDNKCTVHDSYDVSLLMENKVYCSLKRTIFNFLCYKHIDNLDSRLLGYFTIDFCRNMCE